MSCMEMRVGKDSGYPEVLCLENKGARDNWIDSINVFSKCELRAAKEGESLSALTNGTIDTSASSINQFAIMRVKNQEELQKTYEKGKQNMDSIINIQNENRNSFLKQAI